MLKEGATTIEVRSAACTLIYELSRSIAEIILLEQIKISEEKDKKKKIRRN
jgi:hypothetical protein